MKNRHLSIVRSKTGAAQIEPGKIFGVLPVLELLRADTSQIQRIVIADSRNETSVAEIIAAAKAKAIPVTNASGAEISKYFDEDVNHQGVVAFVVSRGYYDPNRLFDEIVARENALCLILDGIEDPRNLGAILRSVEASGADGVFIPERRAAGLTEIVSKSSAGATEFVKIAKVKNINQLIENLQVKGVWVVGASDAADQDYTDWDWKVSTAIVLGNEGKGLHRLTAEKCDALVKIPMYGKIGSLNVSVAAGVILFEAVRNRKN